ncbi:hypothetical protein, partial [Candidatus Borrarchaeum sp.]|uniref:hypothetical protein n=1 Tax=Candidatus Borrarchaeum sp. TaxID=2846742 RepID=UPI00257DEF15
NYEWHVSEDDERVYLTHFRCETSEAPEYFVNDRKQDFKKLWDTAYQYTLRCATSKEEPSFEALCNAIKKQNIEIRTSTDEERLSYVDRITEMDANMEEELAME